jgi:MOSC domain-containing protein YiiM
VAVVDEQAGIVLLWMNFGDTHSYGPGRALVTFEAFKIFGESIHAINAFRLPAQGNRAQLAVGEVIDGAHCDLAPKFSEAMCHCTSSKRTTMKIISVNCGLPRQVAWQGMEVTTSIYKEPVNGRIPLRTLNLEGDKQSDLTVHGGKDKAVYCYPIEHYSYWKGKIPNVPLTMGVFGENFTTEGLSEETVHIGDRFAIGSAEVVVTQPRMPCYKLGIRFQSNDMVKRFLDSRRSGLYLAVLREGVVGAGDEITKLGGVRDSVSITDIVRLYVAKNYSTDDVGLVQRAIGVEALPEGWRDYFHEKLSRLSPGTTPWRS